MEEATRPVMVSPILMAEWATRDTEGNLIRWSWRAPDEDGFWEPVVSVDRTDNIVEAERARLAEAVRSLPAGDSCYCEIDRDVAHDEADGTDVIYVRRAAVLALLEPEP